MTTITAQCIPERLDYIKNELKALKGVVYHVDKERKGSFGSFKDMLSIKVADYRLHLQDDVILADNFGDAIPDIEALMDVRGIDVLSLFAPRRKRIIEAYNQNILIDEFPNFLWLQATMFSARFVGLMQMEIEYTNQTKHDDVFVADVLKKYGVKAYVFLPSLVQHNVDLGSSMSHANSKRRTSPVFDKDFIKKTQGLNASHTASR